VLEETPRKIISNYQIAIDGVQSSQRRAAQLRGYFANSACAASPHMARSPAQA
jgi:hypothetical protein